MNTQLPEHQPLVSVSRGGVIESVHYGSLTVITADGSQITRIGDPGAPMYARSSLKPLQALAMVHAGFTGIEEQVALACASHSGEQFHLDTALSVLHAHGLTETHLRNTPDLPIGVHAHPAAIKAGNEKSSLQQNCSGKHAAMLATCVINGWSLEDYLDPQHPLQRQIRTTIEEVCGEAASNVTIDGCGAPLFYLSLDAMVRGFAHIATTAQNAPDSAEAVVYTAMSSRPELVGGTDRDVTDMMRAFPGLITKDGAEAVQVGAFADGRAFALKISDGGARGRTAATLRALELLGHTDKELTEKHWPTVLGHGEPVGEVAALF